MQTLRLVGQGSGEISNDADRPHRRASPSAHLRRLLALIRRDRIRSGQLQNELLDARRALQSAQAQMQHLSHAAFHDYLTGLPNRLQFQQRSQATLNSHAPGAREFGLIYIDLDGFKAVNDCHGHEVGDALLKATAERLRHAMRSSDLLSRHGGDEFICLLRDVNSEEQVLNIARILKDAVSSPYQLGTLAVQVTVTIGVALYPRDGATIDALLDRADQRMLSAKRRKVTTARCAGSDAVSCPAEPAAAAQRIRA